MSPLLVAAMAGTLAGRAAAPSSQEVGLAVVADLHSSPRQVAGGLGGGVVYRRHHGPLQVWGQLSGLVYSVPAANLRLGVGRALREGSWRPSLGTELSASWGQARVISSANPQPIRGPALSLGLALRPLVFDQGECDVSLFELRAGLPLESLADSYALGLTPVAVTWRW